MEIDWNVMPGICVIIGLTIWAVTAEISKSKSDTNKTKQAQFKIDLEQVEVNKIYAEIAKIEASNKQKELELAQFKAK